MVLLGALSVASLPVIVRFCNLCNVGMLCILLTASICVSIINDRSILASSPFFFGEGGGLIVPLEYIVLGFLQGYVIPNEYQVSFSCFSFRSGLKVTTVRPSTV